MQATLGNNDVFFLFCNSYLQLNNWLCSDKETFDRFSLDAIRNKLKQIMARWASSFFDFWYSNSVNSLLLLLHGQYFKKLHRQEHVTTSFIAQKFLPTPSNSLPQSMDLLGANKILWIHDLSDYCKENFGHSVYFLHANFVYFAYDILA